MGETWLWMTPAAQTGCRGYFVFSGGWKRRWRWFKPALDLSKDYNPTPCSKLAVHRRTCGKTTPETKLMRVTYTDSALTNQKRPGSKTLRRPICTAGGGRLFGTSNWKRSEQSLVVRKKKKKNCLRRETGAGVQGSSKAWLRLDKAPPQQKGPERVETKPRLIRRRWTQAWHTDCKATGCLYFLDLGYVSWGQREDHELLATLRNSLSSSSSPSLLAGSSSPINYSSPPPPTPHRRMHAA